MARRAPTSTLCWASVLWSAAVGPCWRKFLPCGPSRLRDPLVTPASASPRTSTVPSSPRASSGVSIVASSRRASTSATSGATFLPCTWSPRTCWPSLMLQRPQGVRRTSPASCGAWPPTSSPRWPLATTWVRWRATRKTWWTSAPCLMPSCSGSSRPYPIGGCQALPGCSMGGMQRSPGCGGRLSGSSRARQTSPHCWRNSPRSRMAS
mmetsp:Transcript_100468/g.324222  ORF Transcript_100468/g.324222 Transcript_100468/m.324222 type:complete len:208 (+) Transcript_100468:290-913(+)